ncbi:uncharacterized protein LAJ45_07266 [Morchella importuna]|uniref:uncharacterized protein n=1 Tax=Morchella importuna TaxID=1174673 RepID=UPI001E8D72C3|nr:uncharacterized protein LAJ45_07266 [Morchella importuna]KAH8148555.1 hypothetical protein LAJ45_07266 [Morchella importuna]
MIRRGYANCGTLRLYLSLPRRGRNPSAGRISEPQSLSPVVSDRTVNRKTTGQLLSEKVTYDMSSKINIKKGATTFCCPVLQIQLFPGQQLTAKIDCPKPPWRGDDPESEVAGETCIKLPLLTKDKW